jgi:hypothetical protein
VAPFFVPRISRGLLVAGQRNQLKITARQLQLRNIEQLAQTTTLDGITTMGRLDSVSYDSDGTYALSIGGCVFNVPSDHPIDIRRTASADALVIANDIAEDMVDRLEVRDVG